jgi:hypothetical protein
MANFPNLFATNKFLPTLNGKEVFVVNPIHNLLKSLAWLLLVETNQEYLAQEG